MGERAAEKDEGLIRQSKKVEEGPGSEEGEEDEELYVVIFLFFMFSLH